MATIRTTKISINGKEYSSFDQIPAEEREKIKQKLSTLSAGQIGKALFKSLGPFMIGRGNDIPNNLIHELLGDEIGDQVKISFGTSMTEPKAPADLIETSPPPKAALERPPETQYSAKLDRSPGFETEFEGSGRTVIAAIIIAAGLIYYFRDLF